MLFTAPPDKAEVEPCFVVAALIGRADAKSFMEDGECAVKPNFPVPIRFRRLGIRKRPPTCLESIQVLTKVWAREASAKPQSAKASSPCSPVEVTGHHVHLFVKHHCTNRRDELLSYATFLGVNVTNV